MNVSAEHKKTINVTNFTEATTGRATKIINAFLEPRIVSIINTVDPEIVLLVPDRDDAGLSSFAELATAIVSRTRLQIAAIDAITPPKDLSEVRQWKKVAVNIWQEQSRQL